MQRSLMLQNMNGIVLNMRRQLPGLPTHIETQTDANPLHSHGYAHPKLLKETFKVVDVEARQRLRSSSSSSLIVSRTRLSTVGDRVFPVAAARVWNRPPEHVTSAPSVTVFQSEIQPSMLSH